MCGFAALFAPGRRFPAPLLTAMEGDLAHRGPDSRGLLEQPGAALVFRRLAILDPEPASDQPMTDPTGRATLVFNGEIYNYRAVREALRQAGVVLRTDGDTEAILHGYLTWGESVFERLEGMYALCLLDRTRGVALAARDPLGIKPLYMTRIGPLTAFASEIRPLHRLRRPEVDPAALAELLTFGFAAGRLSNYRGIERVPGGMLITVPLAGGEAGERRFADPLETLEAGGAVGEAEVHAAVERSIADHLVSDVGYALQLSGGVDSSLVAAVAAKTSGRRLRSYALTLDGHPFDEAPFQKQIVERYGLDHVAVPVGGADYAAILPDAVAAMEGPTPHGGCVLLLLLCRHIRREFKVVLTGEGADELFGGYLRYRIWRRTRWHEVFGRMAFAGRLPERRPFAGIRRLAGLDAAAYSTVYGDFRGVHRLFPALVPQPGARETASRRFRDFRDRLLAVDQTAYLESLLLRQDKMSMAASVEARTPYAHWPLWRIANRLAHRQRIPGGETKPVLKRLAERWLPHDLVHRRKIGLWLPYEDWLRDERLLGRWLPLLTDADSRLAPFAAPGALAATVDGFRRGGAVPGLRLLMETELWLRQAEKTPEGATLWANGGGDRRLHRDAADTSPSQAEAP